MTRIQDITGIQISDLVISCDFSENYAKNLYQFISENFEYNDFSIENNGIVITITLHSLYDIQIIFKKKAIKNKIEVQIFSVMFNDSILDYYNNYVSFCEMLKRLSEKLKTHNVNI